MFRKIITMTALALTVALTLSVCTACKGRGGSNQPPLASGSVIVADDSIPDRAPNITGMVTGVAKVREGVTVLVEIPGKNNTYADGRVYVTVTNRTILEDADKKRLTGTAAILPGDMVSVWYSGNATGTTPEYAVAQGLRVTSNAVGQDEDLLLTIRLGDTEIMASPAEGEVTRTDVKPLLYGSYLIYTGEGVLHLGYGGTVKEIAANAVPLTAGETAHHLRTDASAMTCEVPANMTAGEYLVTVRMDDSDGADYYMFTLRVQ